MAIPILAASLGAAALSGVANYYGAKEANETNVNIANATNQMNAQEALNNRNFQAHMSNTAHQRAKEDLQKAGLNPILAANNGSSTPGGSQASMSGATVQNTMGPAVTGALTSAMEVKRLGMEMDNQQAELGLKNAQTAQAKMQTAVMAKDIPKADIINEAYKAGKNILSSIKSKIISSPKHESKLDNYQQGWMDEYMKNFKKRQTIKLHGGKP